MDGRTTLTAGNILDDQHWHYATVKRYGRQVNFTVDSQTVSAICNGEFTYLDLDNQVLQRAIEVYIMSLFQCVYICVSTLISLSSGGWGYT